MASCAQESSQPQSQAMRAASVAADRIPSSRRRLTSGTTTAAPRFEHRGQEPPRWWDQQLVRFSEAVMVKNPPRSGTAFEMTAAESARYFCTAGTLVQIVA